MLHVEFRSQSLVPNPGTGLLLVEETQRQALVVKQQRTKHLPEAYGDFWVTQEVGNSAIFSCLTPGRAEPVLPLP